VDHTFNPQLNGAVRLGAQITDYPNLQDLAQSGAVNVDDNSVIPYVDARLTWTYNPGSYMTLGVINTLNQTDVAALAQESVAVYGTLNHRITPKVTGSVVGTFQDSKYKQGIYNGEVDLLYLAGVNLNYAFNPNLSAEAGYNFDRLDSDLPSRSYSRNRVYIGLRATY
jgi:predicted porin